MKRAGKGLALLIVLIMALSLFSPLATAGETGASRDPQVCPYCGYGFPEGPLPAYCTNCGAAVTADRSAPPEPEDTGEGGDWEVRPEFVEPDELILYLAQSAFHVGQDVQTDFTVFCGEGVEGDIEITDEAGTVLAACENDGSGMLTGTLRVSGQQPRTIAVCARSGEAVSQPVRLYVQPKVTGEMVQTLEGVGDELIACATEAIGNGGETSAEQEGEVSDEALEQIEAHLRQDARVADVARIDDVLFYVTEDGLVGSFNMGTPEEGYAGGATTPGATAAKAQGAGKASAGAATVPGMTDALEAFKQAEDEPERELSDTWVQASKSATNNRALILTPQYGEDETMTLYHGISEALSQRWGELPYGQLDIATKDAARRSLLEGSFTDYGFVMINAHGNWVTFPGDGNSRGGEDMMFFTLGSSEIAGDFRDRFADALWVDTRDGNIRSAIRRDTRVVYDISPKPSKKRKRQSEKDTETQVPMSTDQYIRTIRVTRNHFEAVLADKVFDNTFVYLFICDCARDGRFIDLLLRHGASVVIGCRHDFNSGYSLMLYSEIMNALFEGDGSGRYLSIDDGRYNLSADSIKKINGALRWYLGKSEEEVESFEVSFEEAYRSVLQEGRYAERFHRGDAKPWSWLVKGEADVAGKVYGEAAETHQRKGVEGVKVVAWRWLNHAFRQMGETTTKADGGYRLSDLPVGLYVLEARYADTSEYLALEPDQGENADVDIVMGKWLEGCVTDVVTGEAVEGVTVTLLTETGNAKDATTDASGDWGALFLKKNYDVSFSHEDYETVHRAVKYDEARDAMVGAVKSVALQPKPKLIAGTVVDDATDQPVAGVAVDMKGPEGTTTTFTDESGAFEALLPGGHYEVTFSLEGYRNELVQIVHDTEDDILAIRLVSAQSGRVAAVSAGWDSSGALMENGDLWEWGYNEYGEMGPNESSTVPIKVMENVKGFVLGRHVAGIILQDGSLWMCGWNRDGQLGDGTDVDRSTPVHIMDDVREVRNNNLHSAALKEDGTLWTWGGGGRGRLGDGTQLSHPEPIKVMDHVRQIGVGGGHSAALKEDGTLWTWGYNCEGELGDGTHEDRLEPVQIMSGVREISIGYETSAAIKEDGTLWTWGCNAYGALGDGTTEARATPVMIMSNVAAVSVNGYHGAAIKEDGSLWMWGNYNYAGDNIDDDWDESLFRTTPEKIMDDVRAVSLGAEHVMVIKNDGSLYTWGNNEWAQLGDGTVEKKYEPVRIEIPG